MNPFDVAKAAGYTPEKILSYFAKAIPGFDGKMSQAMASGYSVDQVLNFLQKQFSGAKVDRRVQRQLQPVFQGEASFGNRGTLPEKKELNTEIGALAGGVTGAVIGGLAGGIPGAIRGASAGSSAMSDLLKKYEAHKREGGSLSMGDFIKAAIKGGAAGVAALKAPEVLAALQASGSKEELPKEEQGVNVQAQSTTALQPESPVELQGMGPEESFKALEAENLGQFMQGFGTKMSQQDFVDYLKTQMGPVKFKALGDKNKRPAEEIVEQAWEFIQEGAQQPPEAPQEALMEEGENVSRSVNGDVKQIDTAVKPGGEDISLAGVFKKTFSAPDVKPDTKGKKRTIAPLANALKSSNVRGGQWDSETGEMRIIFQPKQGSSEGGSVYTYPNVDKEAWENLTGGKATPLTEGSNIFGFWDRSKKKSIGAAFSAKIKKNADKYPPTQLAEESITVGENQIRTADRAFMVSDLFAPFKKVREHGNRVMRASDLQEWIKDYSDYSQEDTYTMIELIEEKLKGELKNAPADARLKKEITGEFGVTFKPTDKEKEQLAKRAAREAAKKRKK